MNRRRWVMFAFAAGVICFWLALAGMGGKEGAFLGVVVFYPAQFLTWALFLNELGKAWSENMRLVFFAAVCLPWYPLLATLFTSEKQGVRNLGRFLLLIHGLAAAGLLILG